MNEPQPPDTTVQLTAKSIVDALAILVPIATAGAQFLKAEKSYEVVFLAALVALLYFMFRGHAMRTAALERALTAERTAREADRDECQARETKYQGDMQLLREAHAAEMTALDQRRRSELGTLETSLVNAFSDLTAMADRRRVGHFERDPNNHMLTYVRVPVLLPPDVAVDRRTVNRDAP